MKGVLRVKQIFNIVVVLVIVTMALYAGSSIAYAEDTVETTVKVSGTIDTAGLALDAYSIKYVNAKNGKEYPIVMGDNNTFTVELVPGNAYSVKFVGATEYDISDDTKYFTLYASMKEGVTTNVVIIKRELCHISGRFTGFGTEVDMSGVEVTLKPHNAGKENVVIKPQSDGSYSIYVDKDMTYTMVFKGACEYDMTNSKQVKFSTDTVEDIVMLKKSFYKVTGNFLGLAEEAKVTSLVFKHMDDNYTYSASISGNSYSVDLRNGTYELIEAGIEGYKTIMHVTVKDGETSKDILFASTAKAQAISLVQDIYVGYPDKEHNYDTVRAAVAACKAMNPSSEAERITVHIAPGVYREQIIIEVPYVTFKNDEPDKEVKLTWYYGIGYVYYSIGPDGYYSELAAYDRGVKNTAKRWGAATYVKSQAKAFRAENITFEASFNRYVTDEEIADGVTPGGDSAKNFKRKKGVNITSKSATERSAALAVEGTQSEFYNCRILGSQDTLYTGNVKAYFKNCFIEGNTDYIFGSGDIVFDACELSIFGYSDSKASAYITAAADGATYGYIFRNCLILANSRWKIAQPYLGRPWRQSAKVTFINTKLESADMLQPAGWTTMSGNTPENANYKEYNTAALDGAAVDMSARIAGTVVEANPYEDIKLVFDGWTPVYYTVGTDEVVEKPLPVPVEPDVAEPTSSAETTEPVTTPEKTTAPENETQPTESSTTPTETQAPTEEQSETEPSDKEAGNNKKAVYYIIAVLTVIIVVAIAFTTVLNKRKKN